MQSPCIYPMPIDFSPSQKYHDAMSVDPEKLRVAMRKWATGVTIVTAQDQGIRHGMTVSSFTSVSLEPPLVLVSLERGTKTHELVEKSGRFGVSILAEQYLSISDRFAGRQTEQSDRFEGLDSFQLVTGIPLLEGALAVFDCQVVSSYESGTHTLFIGEVLGVMNAENGSPLLYYDQDYHILKE